jgi:hypothetical protein
MVALAALFTALLAETAEAAPMRVVVIPTPTGLPNFEPNFGALERLAKVGAIGILVPDAGPETSRERALAALRRGAVRNSLLDDAPPGEPVIGAPAFGAYRPGGPTIVLTLPPTGVHSNDRRYVIAVIAPGYRGVLTSESTRIPGLVSIADVAPTALGREGKLGSTPSEDALMTLYDLDRQIDRHRDGKTPYLLVCLALVAFFAAFWRRGMLAAVAAVLLGNLVLGMTAYTHATAFFMLLVLALGAGFYALLRPVAQGLLCAGVVAAYLAAMAADERWVALSPLGPTQNGADGGGVIVLLVGFAVLLVLEGWLSRQALLAGAGMLAVLAVALVTGGESHVTDAIRDGPSGLAEDLARRLELSWLRATAGWGVGLLVAGGILALTTAALRDRRPLILAYLTAVAVSLVVNDSPNDVIVAGLAGYLALSTAPGVARRADERARPAAPEPTARSLPAASP